MYPVTSLLIALNVIIMVIMLIINGDFFSLQGSTLLENGAVSFNSPYWTVLTNMFLHVNLFHNKKADL